MYSLVYQAVAAVAGVRTPAGILPFSARTLSYIDGPDGKQVEYEGHPLYLYAGDSSQRWMLGSGDDTKGDVVRGDAGAKADQLTRVGRFASRVRASEVMAGRCDA